MNLADIKGCIIIPTYNNQNTLKQVIDGVLKYADGNRIIVINDGSTDNTSKVLSNYKDQLVLLTNSENKGKGFSLRKSFAEAINRGFENAITIDSDGQHFPDDIPMLIAKAIENPGVLLMGSRDMSQPGVPKKSSFGNKFSNFWFYVEAGIRLPDTQTGYRLYPLVPLKKIKLFTTKFETEIEVIVKLAWQGVKIIPVKVKVLYDMDERVTHFRPFKDFTRITILRIYLVTLSLLYYAPKRLLKKNIFSIIKQEAIKPHESNRMKAASIGFGVFMGILPVWGFQLLIGISLSILFKMNKVLFLAAANISIPPLIPVVIYLSYLTGGIFIKNNSTFPPLGSITLESIHIHFVQYFIGGTVLATTLGLLFFALAYCTLSIVRPKK